LLGTRRLIFAFIRAGHWTLPWARWIQTMCVHSRRNFLSSITVVFSDQHLLHLSCLYSSEFRTKNL
jgi:hypothetical protein